MATLRVGLAQLDFCVGDLAGNAGRILAETGKAAADGAHLVVFPEMALTGYPPEDLVLRRSFQAASVAAVHRLAARLAGEGLGRTAVVVGYLDRCPDPSPAVGRPAGEPQNTAAVLYDGRVVTTYAKHHLPNYGVFDEFRYFVPGDRLPVVRLHGVDVAVTICEDLWQTGGPVTVAARAGVDLLLCINGSPYERGKADFRRALVHKRAREAGAPLAYVNLVGGQDELVFDGGSLLVDASGEVVARAPQFEEGVLLVDVDTPATAQPRPGTGRFDALDGTTMTVERFVLAADPVPAPPRLAPTVAPQLDDLAEVYAALVTGTRDYARKNGFSSVVLGLSGGIDSALTATIAADALGPEAVHVVALPSRHSSEHSLADAEDLATRQRLQYSVLPIDDMVAAYEAHLELAGLAAENLQARVRGTALMALSNAHGHLVLTTGNKSELATGYSTLYGDSAGGFAPIKDVPKTLVWELARWRNAAAAERGEIAPIPANSISKEPSAELAPGQLDRDRLPAYDELDALLEDYIVRDRGCAELVAAGHDPELVTRVVGLVDAAEYKRRQNPPGPRISLRAFGRDRRQPITNCWRERPPDPHVTPQQTG